MSFKKRGFSYLQGSCLADWRLNICNQGWRLNLATVLLCPSPHSWLSCSSNKCPKNSSLKALSIISQMVKLFQVSLALSASSGSSGLVLDPASPWIDLNKRANVLAKTRKLEGKNHNFEALACSHSYSCLLVSRFPLN